jgi:putative ATP-binding cassette transporter
MRKYRGFLKKLLRLMAPIWYSKHKHRIRKWSVAMLALVVLQMLLAIVVSQWTAGIFNALEMHSIAGIIQQILALIIIFAGSIAINSAHMHVKRNLQVTLRTWLTENVIDRWVQNGNPLKLLKNPTPDNDNPDGRIASDIRMVADGFIDLTNGLVYNVLLLVGFTAVLWELSGVVVVGGIALHGYLVWLAVVYSAVASGFGYIASKPLTEATNDMNTAEADMRFELVEVKENCAKIAFCKKEEETRKKLHEFVKRLKEKYNIQTAAWQKIIRFTSAYSALNLAAPILAAAPQYIAGKLTLGGLMQSATAFSQMVGALSFPVNAAPGIAVWRASVERVLSFIDEIDRIA